MKILQLSLPFCNTSKDWCPDGRRAKGFGTRPNRRLTGETLQTRRRPRTRFTLCPPSPNRPDRPAPVEEHARPVPTNRARRLLLRDRHVRREGGRTFRTPRDPVGQVRSRTCLPPVGRVPDAVSWRDLPSTSTKTKTGPGKRKTLEPLCQVSRRQTSVTFTFVVAEGSTTPLAQSALSPPCSPTVKYLSTMDVSRSSDRVIGPKYRHP